jgi:hypothetical protein
VLGPANVGEAEALPVQYEAGAARLIVPWAEIPMT